MARARGFPQGEGHAQDATFPITAREAVSLVDAHRLYQKSVKLVTEVNARAASGFPELSWWTPGSIAVFVQRQFRDKGRYTLGVWNRSLVGLLFGLEPGPSDEGTFTIWLESDPKHVAIR